MRGVGLGITTIKKIIVLPPWGFFYLKIPNVQNSDRITKPNVQNSDRFTKLRNYIGFERNSVVCWTLEGLV
jgi:hypothetical protein